MLHELINNHLWFVCLALTLLFLAVGSLLNVIIYRLPQMLENGWRRESQELLHLPLEEKTRINLFVPRSFCPSCKKMVREWQNIPLLSYLFLRGRCAHCHNPISLRYPLIELLTTLLSLFACWHFGPTPQLPFALLALWFLICLFFIDLEHQILPDCPTLTLLWSGLIANTNHLFTSLPNAVLSAAGAYLSLYLLIKLFYWFTGKIGMGQGDFKLFAAFGAWFGWEFLPLILLFSSIFGTIIGLFYLCSTKKDKDTPIPFGPFLCVAGIAVLFWGKSILNWYLYLWF